MLTHIHIQDVGQLAVVGGAPGGMEAARVACAKGSSLHGVSINITSQLGSNQQEAPGVLGRVRLYEGMLSFFFLNRLMHMEIRYCMPVNRTR